MNRSRHPICHTICPSKTLLYKPERVNRHTRNPIRFPVCGVRSGHGQSCQSKQAGDCNVGTVLEAHSEANWLVGILHNPILLPRCGISYQTKSLQCCLAAPASRGLHVAYRFCTLLAYAWPLCWLIFCWLRGQCGFITEVEWKGI